MIIHCARCESKVDARVLASHRIGEIPPEMVQYSFVICPVCDSAMLAQQELGQIDAATFDWDNARRLWPDPERSVHWELPDGPQIALDEAQKCFNAGAYNACAVMCGRVLESICAEHQTRDRLLGGGLKELVDRGVIDRWLFEWGEELRRHRNIGAHASSEKISKQDARDLLEFAKAICDYIFVLTAKFRALMDRRKGD